MSRQQGPLNARERAILDVLVTMHREYGPTVRFTREAVEHIVGPCAGSLAGLALRGYAEQRVSPEGLTYQVTENGWALFAGVEGQI